jgi:hypothetical protein
LIAGKDLIVQSNHPHSSRAAEAQEEDREPLAMQEEHLICVARTTLCFAYTCAHKPVYGGQV